MMQRTWNAEFWRNLDRLLNESELVIDRPKGSRHPRIPEILYPLDYGYLKNTSSMDGEGIDVWRGSLPVKCVQGVVVTVDMWKRDSEIKLLVGLTEDEIITVMNFLNKRGVMSGMLILREE